MCTLQERKVAWSGSTIGNDELEEIINSFENLRLTQGAKVRQFEEVLTKVFDVPYVIAVSNGSIALEIMLQIYGIGQGDEVIVPSNTYFATAAAVSRRGATPVFVDMCPLTQSVNPDLLEAACSRATKAVLYIDYGGFPTDFEKLKIKCEQLGLKLLHDGAQSLGGYYKERPLLSLAETTTTSFHMAKLITTVEGGALFTHNEEVALKARSYRSQGEIEKYIHAYLGTNARMTDIMAAIGIHQLKKLGAIVEKRRQVFNWYKQYLDSNKHIQVLCNQLKEAEQSNFIIALLAERRNDLAVYLKNNGIETRVCYPMPVYEQPVYRKGNLPIRIMPSLETEKLCKNVINPPVYPTLSEEDVQYVCGCINEFYGIYS